MRISIVNPKRKFNDIPLNAEVILMKDKNNPWDATCIKALYNGVDIGNLSANPTTLGAGCQTSGEIYNLIEDGVKAKVLQIGNYTNSLGRTDDLLIAEILDEKAPKSKKTNTSKDVDLVLNVKGAKTRYPKKTDLLNAYNNKGNQLPDITLKIVDNDIIAYFEDGEAGIVDTKKYQDTNDFEEAFNVISSIGGEVQGVVEKASISSFRVKFSISEKTVKEASEAKIKKTIEDLKEEAVNKGWVEESVVDEIIAYLTKYNVNHELIVGVLTQYENDWTDEEKGMIYKFKKEDIPFVDTPEGLNLNICLGSELENLHLQFVGNKGGGKNVLINTISWILQRPLISFPANPNADKFDILGAKGIESEVLSNGAVKMTTSFQKEALVKAMERGYILCMDEINMIDPGVLAILHGPADDRRNLDVPSYEHIEAKDKFIIISTMNEEYEGTVRLNEALIDRMIQVEFERPNSIKDILKMKLKGKADVKDINVCDQIFKAIEEQIQDQKLDASCSTIRGYIQALKICRFVGLKQALINCVANKVREKDERQSLIALIDSFI